MSSTPPQDCQPLARTTLSPAGETVNAAIAVLRSATIDGPLAIVPTASLKQLEEAVNALFRAATPEKTDNFCSN